MKCDKKNFSKCCGNKVIKSKSVESKVKLPNRVTAPNYKGTLLGSLYFILRITRKNSV